MFLGREPPQPQCIYLMAAYALIAGLAFAMYKAITLLIILVTPVTGEKRYHPYSVPELAQAMVKALDKDDGYEGKRLMLIYRTGALSLV